MRRRDFISLVGGSTVAWPLAAHAQPGEHVRRIAVLSGLSATTPDAVLDKQTFEKSLQDLGWTSGRNVTIEYRWSALSAADAGTFARELLGRSPEVILAIGTTAITGLINETKTVPIVFTRVSDPIGQGFVANFAHPGGNVTGFSNFEPAMAGKWLQILKDIAPNLTRVAVIASPAALALDSYYRSIESVSASLAVEVIRASVQNLSDIDHTIADMSANPGGALVVVPDALILSNRAAFIAQVTKHRVPTIYPFRFFASEGGLASYGIDTKEQFRGAASYVDRILRGEKPGDLPVQLPVKFELVINLTAAKALDLTIPPAMLSLADEVIE